MRIFRPRPREDDGHIEEQVSKGKFNITHNFSKSSPTFQTFISIMTNNEYRLTHAALASNIRIYLVQRSNKPRRNDKSLIYT